MQAASLIASVGGNAVDAAIAAALTVMGTEPGMVSLGSGGFVSIWPRDGQPVVFDGNVAMPGIGQQPERFGQGLMEITTTYGGGLTLFAGSGSVAVPGTIAALGLAHQGFAALPWPDALTPAAAACRTGYPIGAATASYLALTGDLVYSWDPQTREQVSDSSGEIVTAGVVKRNEALAETLDALGTHGWSYAYNGELGRALAADQAARGGLITQADLDQYQALRRDPVRCELGDWTVALNPPPSVGGPMLAVMLAGLRRQGTSWADVIDIQRHALTYRSRVHDLSHDLEGDGYDLLEQVEKYGLESLPTSASTAHVSVVDADGLACAITMSSGYGSGATIPDTGVMLNNCLGEPELNRLGLHALEPGLRLASNMAPTTARTSDGRVLAIGSPGADRITTALMQVLGRYCLMGHPLQESIDAPRLHIKVLADGGVRVDHEADPQVRQAAEHSGLPTYDHGPSSMFFGGVGAALREADGTLVAAADPRRESATGVY